MGWSLDELEAKVDGNDLAEWQAYFRIRPMPDGYWTAALIAQTIANAFGGGKRFKLEDFLPIRTIKTPTAKQALARFDLLTSIRKTGNPT